MNKEDNLSSKKETTVKTMAQRMAEMKKRKGERADAGHNPDEQKDEDSNDEDDGIMNSTFAQQSK